MSHPSNNPFGQQTKQASKQPSHDTSQALLSLVQDVFGDVPDDAWDITTIQSGISTRSLSLWYAT